METNFFDVIIVFDVIIIGILLLFVYKMLNG